MPFNTAVAAQKLGVSRPTLLRWFRERRISPVARDWRGWREFTERDLQRIRLELGEPSELENEDVNTKLLDYLSKVPTFSRLPRLVLSALAANARFQGYLKGSSFFAPGERSAGLHLLVKGRIRVFRLSPEGKEQLLAMVVPFQTIGEAAIFRPGEKHSSFAVCEESSTVLTLPPGTTRLLTHSHPELALAFLNEFATRIEDLERRLEETALYPLERRLASYLLEQSDSEERFLLPSSSTDLASRFGVARESVSRALVRFEEAGFIRRHGRTVEILQPGILAGL